MKKYLIVLVLLIVPLVASAQTFDHNLYFGVQGSTDVTKLQEFLTNQGFYSGPISGNFFSLTLSAVKKYQSKIGVTASGYFGPLTRAKANVILSQQPQASNNEAALQTSSTPPVSAPTNTGGTASSLQTQLNSLLQQVAQMKVQQQNQQTSPQATNWGSWADYQNLPANFFKNPPAYLGNKVKVFGTATDFLAKGDRGGDTNYVKVLALTSSGDVNSVVFDIPNNDNYQKVIALINKNDGIAGYGTITKSSSFSLLSGGEILLPTIEVTRVDKCELFICTDTENRQSVFPAGIVVTKQTTLPPPTSPVVAIPPPQPEALKTWHTVVTYSDYRDFNTDKFLMQGTQWRISYTCETGENIAYFYGSIKSADSYNGENFAVGVNCPANNSSPFYSETPGYYYLNFSTVGKLSYTVTVEDYY